MTRTIIAAGVAVVGLAGGTAAHAETSSPFEYQGYASCVAAARAESLGLTTGRTYYLDEQENASIYYVNATRWEDGQRQAVRIECQTSPSGRTLYTAAVTPGQFVDRAPSVRVEVAAK